MVISGYLGDKVDSESPKAETGYFPMGLEFPCELVGMS